MRTCPAVPPRLYQLVYGLIRIIAQELREVGEMTIDWLWITLGFLFALGMLSMCWAMWLTARISYRIYNALTPSDQEGDDGKS